MKLPLLADMAHCLKVTVPDGRFKWIDVEPRVSPVVFSYDVDFTSIRLASVFDLGYANCMLRTVSKILEEKHPKCAFELSIVRLTVHPSFFKTDKFRAYKLADLSNLRAETFPELRRINDEFWRAGRNEEMPSVTLTLNDELSVRYKRVAVLFGHLKNELAYRRKTAKLRI